jgi:hypothetical protein
MSAKLIGNEASLIDTGQWTKVEELLLMIKQDTNMLL